jgi:surfactin synthase thioesterase subunit
VFRSDFTLVETWAAPRSPEPLPVLLSVFAGRHDKLVGEDRLLAWRAFTTRFRGLERYEGDHFYLMHHQHLLAVAITAAMRSAAP